MADTSLCEELRAQIASPARPVAGRNTEGPRPILDRSPLRDTLRRGIEGRVKSAPLLGGHSNAVAPFPGGNDTG